MFEMKNRINYYTKNPLGLTGNFIVMKKTVSKNAVPLYILIIIHEQTHFRQGCHTPLFLQNYERIKLVKKEEIKKHHRCIKDIHFQTGTFNMRFSILAQILCEKQPVWNFSPPRDLNNPGKSVVHGEYIHPNVVFRCWAPEMWM